MGGGTEPDNMRSKVYKPIIGIRGLVVERYMYSQNFSVMYFRVELLKPAKTPPGYC